MTDKEKSSEEIQYIPNPLPLPKKHKQRELQFDFEPGPELLEFDVEVREGQEDFDI